MTADERARLQAQIDAARAELHHAQSVVALLDVADEVEELRQALGHPPHGPVDVARGVIERDLAARRVEAWVALLDRLRAEGRRVGLFA